MGVVLWNLLPTYLECYSKQGRGLITILSPAPLKRGIRSMKKILLPLVAMALTVLLSLSVSGSIPEDAQALTAKPNIVFILTDDMRKDDMMYMPKTRSVLKAKGMSFSHAFVSNALCCPSRATIMRGQYSHNTKVWTNGGPSGGWQAFRNNGLQRDNVATRLDSAGYRTALIGKYFNGYNTTSVPPGWDRWFATEEGYFNYDANDQGTIRHFGTDASDYQTDVLKRRAKAFVGTSVTTGKPFFAYVAPIAPHREKGSVKPVPAPRDEHTYDGLKAPRTPSFNEPDVSDKPSWIRKLPKLSAAQKAKIDDRHEKRAESLQAVDDLVAGVVGKLSEEGVLGNTYIFFTSDNGEHEGEHGIKGDKWRPYEEDVRMPLLVRGPDVAAGHQAYELALNTDYLPTFTDLACSPDPILCETLKTQNNWYVPDGRSLRPVLEGNATTWRNAILLEGAQNTTHAPAYRGIRTVSTDTTSTERKYVEYENTERELYDLGADPYELTNRYDATAPPADLVSRLRTLETCKGDGCLAAEDGQ
jgi:N-acetylglucosamine-6-sulfatase